MKNISIVEIDWEKTIQYCHSENENALNLEVTDEVYKQIEEMPIKWVKTLIETILLSPNSINDVKQTATRL